MTDASTFKDRKVGLVVFGIFQIILGALCALFIPLMILGMIAGRNTAQGASLGTAIPGLIVYIFLAAWFISMGVGSIMARRWARALSLIFSWVWMICGVIGILFMAAISPALFAQMSQDPNLPPAALKIVKIIMFGTLSVFYVFLPAVFLFFYRSPHVKATCEARDAQERWTDRRPLPVLALSLLFGFWALSMLFLAFYNWSLPFFGFILNGPAGAAAAIVLILLSAYVAWGTWHLRMAAWWCAVLSTLLWTLSTLVTFARMDLMDMYEKMNFPPEQIEMMKQTPMPPGELLIPFAVVSAICFLAYLFYTKRFFQPAAQTPAP